MLELGTIIRIKSAIEIDKTLNANKYYKSVLFTQDMYRYCGYKCSICGYNDNGTYRIKEDGPNQWNWLPEWFDVIQKPNDFWNDGSKEQWSLCLALIRQTMSENQPSLDILTNPKFTEFPAQEKGGFDYWDFCDDGWIGDKIAKNIPDWPCLKLKPEILEKAIKNCLEQHCLEYFIEVVNESLVRWFRFHETPEGYKYWNNIANDQYNTADTFKSEKSNNLKTEKEYENQLQRKKSDLVRGTVPEGNIICGRKRKTSVSVGHLSNKVCFGI